MRYQNIFSGGSTINTNGSININGVNIDFDDIIGTCKRLLENVSDEDKIEFANEILADLGNISEEQRRRNSTLVTEERPASFFNEIEVEGACSVHFFQSTEFGILLDGKQKSIDNISTVIDNGVLKIKQRTQTINPKSTNVYVKGLAVRRIETKGSCDFTVDTDLILDDDLELSKCGSGDVILPSVECENLSIDIVSSGKVRIGELVADSTDATIQGSGDISYDNVKIRRSAKLSVQGSGDIDIYGTVARVRASVQGSGDIRGEINCDNLAASVMGSGDINFSGNIKSHTKSVMGSGDIHIN